MPCVCFACGKVQNLALFGLLAFCGVQMNSPVVSNGFRVPVYRIPVFGLYGTAADPQRAGYAHIENISCRAPTNDWTIHAHRHAGLAQCLFVQRGGGTFELEGQIIAFSAPWYAWLPSAVVHGFQFEIGTEGYVLTMSDDMVSSCLGRSIESERLAPLVHEPIHGPVPSDAEIGISVSNVMQAIMREHDLPRSGVNAALQAYLALLLVSFCGSRRYRISIRTWAVPGQRISVAFAPMSKSISATILPSPVSRRHWA